MTAFLRKNKKEEKEEGASGSQLEQDKPKQKEEGKKSKGKKKKISEELKENAELVERVIVSPVVSEDAMNKNAINKYVFEVAKDCNKKEIAQAVRALYGVDVIKVNVIRKSPQSHRFRMAAGQKKGRKKAVVTIKSGQEIKLFSE
ncbi:MAG: 50S ribosomal protein L23 [Candidatus Moranbacteria bacterium]|nr:50S ribosomal protein L23 [Candidatus Moranbacteria bacterium]